MPEVKAFHSVNEDQKPANRGLLFVRLVQLVDDLLYFSVIQPFLYRRPYLFEQTEIHLRNSLTTLKLVNWQIAPLPKRV